MCAACEQGDRERVWALIDIISLGQLPAGHTEADLLALGLPLPRELYREEQADGTILIRQQNCFATPSLPGHGAGRIQLQQGQKSFRKLLLNTEFEEPSPSML